MKQRSSGHLRRLFAVAGVMAIASTGLVAIVAKGSLAGASNPPVAAVGSVDCQAFTGHAKFDPPLLDGAAGTSTVTFSGQISDCSGSVPAIIAATIKGTVSVPADCTQALAVDGVSVGPSSYRVKWAGTGKIADTEATNPAGTLPQFELSVLQGLIVGGDLGGALTGSFAANDPAQTSWAGFASAPVPIATSCTPKMKGEPGTGGLKQLVFSSGQFHSFT
jgi:hypothetical protein